MKKKHKDNELSCNEHKREAERNEAAKAEAERHGAELLQREKEEKKREEKRREKHRQNKKRQKSTAPAETGAQATLRELPPDTEAGKQVVLSEFLQPSETEESLSSAPAALAPITPAEAVRSTATTGEKGGLGEQEPATQEEAGQHEEEEGEFQMGSDPTQEATEAIQDEAEDGDGRKKGMSNQTLKRVMRRENHFHNVKRSEQRELKMLKKRW